MKTAIKPKKADFLNLKYELLVPLSIFSDRKITILESLVEYLKEDYKFSYSEISKLTNRDQRNIRTIYIRAKDKRLTKITPVQTDFFFPLKIVRDRSKSIFETIILHLRTEGATNKQLSIIFNRSRKTISTIYNRAKNKK